MKSGLNFKMTLVEVGVRFGPCGKDVAAMWAMDTVMPTSISHPYMAIELSY